MDPREIDLLGSKSPQASALATQAEEAIRVGQLYQAAELYLQARKVFPHGSLAPRRHCEVLTALGRRTEAQEACARALEYGASVRDLRAAVDVIMMPGKWTPTADDFVDATTMAVGARRQLPGHPSGYAALAEIARRLGDWEMMRMQLTELDRVAPDDDDTQRAHARAERPWLRWRIVGWAALLLVCLTGAVRVVRRFVSRAPVRTGSAAVLTFVLVTILGRAPAALAAVAKPIPPGPAAKAAEVDDKPPEVNGFSEFQIDDNDPVGTLPLDKANKNPLQFGYLLMDIAGRAEDAEKRWDYPQAIKYYQALAKAVPDRSVSYGHICKCYQAMKDRSRAIDACEAALAREGVRLEDYRRYVDLVLETPAELTAKEKEDVTAVIKHLRSGPAESMVLADELQCQYALRIGDMALLEAGVAGMVKAVPKEGKTIGYQWSLAMAKGNLEDAARLVQRAKVAGIKADGIATMTEATKALGQKKKRLPLWGGFVVAAAAISLAFWYFRRARTGQPAHHPA